MTVKAPICNVCGSAHWLREPHVFTGKAEPVEVFNAYKESRKPQRRRAALSMPGIPTASALEAQLNAIADAVGAETKRQADLKEKEVRVFPDKSIFDKNAYQREYMRKKREAKKAKAV